MRFPSPSFPPPTLWIHAVDGIYGDWITYETGVKGEFNIEKNWEFVPSISFKLEMLLGGT